jgi:hypothetical protein
MTKERRCAMAEMDAQWQEVLRRGYPRRRPPQGSGAMAGPAEAASKAAPEAGCDGDAAASRGSGGRNGAH